MPAQTARTLRPWLLKVWKARGGGFYACGFVVCFVYLEASTLIREILQSEGVISFFTAQLFEFVFRFFGQSFRNLLLSFVWPAPVVAYRPPLGIAMLVVAYLLFKYALKEPLERWLFRDD